MADVTTHVGLDVHQASIAVARLTGRERTPESWEIPNDQGACVVSDRALQDVDGAWSVFMVVNRSLQIANHAGPM